MSRKTSNRLLWTGQFLLAALFLFAGSLKFILPADKMQGPISFPISFIHFIGACEIAGGLGLILPGLLRIAPQLTTFAAAGLLIIMVGATSTTVIGMGVAPALFPLTIGAIAAAIAWGRRQAV
ncbi:MAG TPA: DoxX family protein [Gemmatimonadaceae bacterium]